jgi:hypothetical protein
MSRKAKRCPGCRDSGIRCPSTPSCRLPRLKGWTVVERRDMCDRYPNDLAAAAALFQTVKWVTCANGGLHAVGRDPLGARPRHKVSHKKRTQPDRSRAGQRPKEDPDHVQLA